MTTQLAKPHPKIITARMVGSHQGLSMIINILDMAHYQTLEQVL